MPNDSLSLLQRLQEYGLLGYAWLLLLSLWAGTVRYITSLNGSKPTFYGWMTENIVSGFVGVLTAMICQYYGVDYLLTAAITGISAHNGTRSLYILGQLLKKNTPIPDQLMFGQAKLKKENTKTKTKSDNNINS